MKKGLIYALPVLLTACGDPSNIIPTLSERGDPYNIFDTTIRGEERDLSPFSPINITMDRKELLRPYHSFLAQNNKVVKATGFYGLPEDLQEKVWDKVVGAEFTGLPPTAPLPQQYLDNNQVQVEEIDITREEAYDIYAAHLAHALWVEQNEIVPWSMTKYSQQQLEDLLKPTAWFSIWDDEKEEYSIRLILDHSPRETFSLARNAVTHISDQKSAMNYIIRAVRPFEHGGGNDPEDIVTMSEMNGEEISRHGCQSMSLYIIRLANSLNIPGKYINGFYGGKGHRSALFEFTNHVLAHGDDVYHYTHLGNTPSSELMGSYDFWKENVLSYQKGDPTAAHNSMLHTRENEMQYPSQSLLLEYCDEGRPFLDSRYLTHEFGPFATVQKIDTLEKRLLILSNNCTEPFPENNPDKVK